MVVQLKMAVALLAAAVAAYLSNAGLGTSARRHPYNIGSALRPCPAGLETLGVREFRSRPRLKGACFAIRGRLRAAVAEGAICHMRPASTHSVASESKCPAGWILSDLSDSPVEVRRMLDGEHRSTVDIEDAGSPKEPSNTSIRPLLACNHDSAGKPIMPPGTRFRLPRYTYSQAAALNNGLRDITVVAFGGAFARDSNPDSFEDFTTIWVTHLCRLPQDRVVPSRDD